MQYIYSARISSLCRKLWSGSGRFFKMNGFFPILSWPKPPGQFYLSDGVITQVTKNFLNDNKVKAASRIITGKISVHILQESF